MSRTLGTIGRISAKVGGYICFNWKRLLVANIIGFSVQGVLIALFLFLGMSGLLAIIIAKVSSWVLFLATMAK